MTHCDYDEQNNLVLPEYGSSFVRYVVGHMEIFLIGVGAIQVETDDYFEVKAMRMNAFFSAMKRFSNRKACTQ